jgi:hypothetical protein
VFLIVILSNKLDLNQETRFNITVFTIPPFLCNLQIVPIG